MTALTPAQVQQFDRDGLVLCEGLFDKEEIELLRSTARADRELLARSYGGKDAGGRDSRLSLWNHPGDDLYGMFARCDRVVSAMEQLLRGEVYHYHSKMILKDPEVAGAVEWHQDYGYWYQNGCLFPDMASCWIAVDRATRENGCLQVLKGSHRLGRLDHGRVGGQTSVDPERLAQAMKRLEHLYCEMRPGSALFFHCNVLHGSAPNTSTHPRWSLISCYNAAANDPYKDHHHPRYTPLSKVDDAAIKRMGARPSVAGAAYLDPTADKTFGFD